MTERMTDVQKAHQRVGNVIGAGFHAEHPLMMDWAAVGFELNRIRQLEAQVEAVRGLAGRELLHATNDYDNGWNDACNRIQYGIDAALKGE